MMYEGPFLQRICTPVALTMSMAVFTVVTNASFCEIRGKKYGVLQVSYASKSVFNSRIGSVISRYISPERHPHSE